ncbi:ComEC/Rec2 family competence protein [Nocardioides sp. GXZ039]|uniref:ComEC/Rec2 family competence protein n=1 Tax=Nocardioides sp. GXZ039 TaxID=3136018 RepID=UPI0030F41B84
MPEIDEAEARGRAESAPADLRAPLLAAAAWGGGLLAGGVRPGVAVAVVLAVAVSVGVTVRVLGHSARPLITVTTGALMALAVLGSALLRTEAITTSPVAALAKERAAVEVLAVVTADPRPVKGAFADGFAVRVTVHEVVGRGWRHGVNVPALVLGDQDWGDVELGAVVSAGGRLSPAESGDLAGVLLGATTPRVVRGPDVWWRGAGAVRASIREAVAGRPADQRALVPALVDGDDAALSDDLAADFRTCGLTHLTAVSGTNLTLVVGFLLVIARWCRVRGRWLGLVAVLGIVGFVLLARTEPSVLRAAAMGTVGLMAMAAGSRRRAFRGLAVAAIVLLLLEPGLATSAGFALSVLATAGIVVLAPGWRDALARWLPRWLAEAIVVPAAAQVACTPVVAGLSGQVSLVAVAANLLVGPVVGPATVLGLAGGLVGLVSAPLGAVLGTGAAWCVGWIVAVARHGADLPVAALDWGSGAVSLALLTAVCAAVAAAAPWLLRSPWRTVPATALATMVVTVPLPTPGWPPPDWVLAMCDVGQGDALALRVAEHSAIVIDAGPDPSAVDRCLDRLEIQSVPLVVLTHFHADHVDGLPGVLGRPVGEIWTTSLLDPPESVRAVMAEAGAVGLQPLVSPATARQIGPVTLQPLWPEQSPASYGPGDGSTANEASVVLLAEVAGLRILLTGDLEPPGQLALQRAYPGLTVDVLKVPHHGSRFQDVEWLTSLQASLALVSVGADNDYGHPAPSLLDALAAAGARLARTDRDGDVLVVAGPDGPRLLTQHDGGE